MEALSREQKYAHMRESLNEKQWRQYVAMEAKERGNLAEVAREAKVSTNTIRRGMREVEAGDVYKEGERIRKGGGGRKPLVEHDKTLLADLEGLLEPKGDPLDLFQNRTLSSYTRGRFLTLGSSAPLALAYSMREGFTRAKRASSSKKQGILAAKEGLLGGSWTLFTQSFLCIES